MAVLCCLVVVRQGWSQAGAAVGSSSTLPTNAGSSAVQVRTIHGQVANALTGAAVPRALVTLNARKVLTDFQGRFDFPDFAGVPAFVSVMKPGYSQSADAGEMYVPQKILDPSVTIELKLYPNAVVSGTVAALDGVALSQIPIRLLRANYDGSGVRWLDAGYTMTNSRGLYRFLVPAGRYRLALGYTPRRQEEAEVVLPLTFPVDTSGSGSASYMAVSPGEERQVDLRPRTGSAHPVVIRIDGGGSRSNVRFTAEPPSGEIMNLNASVGSTPGEYRVELPAGSYLIHAQGDTREESLFGTGHVTVGGDEAVSLTLHLVPTTSLPIQVAVDPASNSGNGAADPGATPSVAMFGLSLHHVSGDGGDASNSVIPARPREDRTFEFRVPPGRYRLSGNGGGNWYVEAATYGGVSNLLTDDLAIASGSGGEPIRLVASNMRGSLQGQVTLPAGAGTAWVYFFPRRPALAIPNAQPTGSDGSFSASVPAGSYFVAAFSHRIQEDLRDAETVAALTAGAKTVEVTSGTNASVNLEISHTKETPE